MTVIVRQFEKHNVIFFLTSFLLLMMLIATMATLPLVIQDMFLKYKMNERKFNQLAGDELIAMTTVENKNEYRTNTFEKSEDTNDRKYHNIVKRLSENKTHKHETTIGQNHKPLSLPNNRLHPRKCILLERRKDEGGKSKNLEQRKICKEVLNEVKDETTHSSRFDWLFKIPEATEKSIMTLFKKPSVLTATMNEDHNGPKISTNKTKEESPIMTVIMKRETPIIVEKNEKGDLFDVFEKGMGIFGSLLFPIVTEKSDTNHVITDEPLEFGEDSVDDVFDDVIFPRFFREPNVDQMEGFLGEIIGETKRFEKKMNDLWDDREEGRAFENKQIF